MNPTTTLHRRALLAATLAGLAATLAACGGEGEQDAGSPFGLTPWPDAAATGPEPGDRAPNFTLETVDGAPITLAALAGAPVVLNFFASWCTNCKEEMGAMQTAHLAGTTVVGIDLRESADTVRALAAETGATFPLALDRTGDVTRGGFRIVNLPATVVLDATGVIRAFFRGPIEADDIAAAVAAAGGS